MPGLLTNIDPDGLLEYSVVYTDRSLNHMSQSFQSVMNDVSTSLKDVYNAQAVIVVPGGGTYAMEAVARQFATNQNCLVLRNGWFSFRWSQIFEMGSIPSEEIVMKACRVGEGAQAPFAPADINEVVDMIKMKRPNLVLAPHVETASGIILPDDYIRSVADAVHSVGGMFVLDCIASGAIWVDMEDSGVDILISAPQKGWSSSPAFGLVMLSGKANEAINKTQSTSFSCDLLKWLQIMQAYENGAHAYHATMPTDAIKRFRDTIIETESLVLIMLVKNNKNSVIKLECYLRVTISIAFPKKVIKRQALLFVIPVIRQFIMVQNSQTLVYKLLQVCPYSVMRAMIIKPSALDCLAWTS